MLRKANGEITKEGNIFYLLKSIKVEAGEPAQQLRALVLAEDPGSVPSTHMMRLTGTCNFNPRRSGAIFWPLSVPCTHSKHTFIHTGKTFIQIK